MKSSRFSLAWLSTLAAEAALTGSPVLLSSTLPDNASQPLPSSFVSYSIEFSSFPDFAGNLSSPNNFSYNLISNLGKLQGSNPIVRAGGNTQDYATFNASQSEALIGTFNFNKSKDYPTTISIGPSYFESYQTWPNVSFLHGFNLGKNGSIGLDTLTAEVPHVCAALNGSRLAYFQLGNEPDLYKTSAQGPVRPAWWNETYYVDEWLNKTELIRQLVQQNCPDVIQQGKFKFYAPSFAGTSNSLNMIRTWQAGLNNDNDVAFIDSHNYIGGATQPGVTLQGTLMNHSSTVASVQHHVNETAYLRNYTNLPYILGETNSLYNEGAPGLSNSFGATLWGVDFNLYCASVGISRVHMHQGTNYRYQAWQPTETVNVTKGTKAPYYGNVMVATMLGDLIQNNVSITNIDLGSIYDTAYAAYINGTLTRLAVIQMREYNTTNGTSGPRPNETVTFQLPTDSKASNINVQWLMANGSDAITGVTFNGFSYNYELQEGLPVLLQNVTGAQSLSVGTDGVISLNMPWSSAAILDLVQQA